MVHQRNALVRRARIFFTWLAWIFAISILIQSFLAGLALFVDSSHWASHANFAKYVSGIPVFMLVVSFIAGMPASLRLQIGALIGMILLIIACAMFSSRIGFISALHPVIAILLFFRTMAVIRQTDSLIKRQGGHEIGTLK